MVGFLLRAAISALGLWVASQLLDGCTSRRPPSSCLRRCCSASSTLFVRPLAFILTLPITVVTLGLFLLC